MTACQEVTEAYPEKMETNPEEMQSEAVHEEVLKEEASVKSFGAMKKWHRGQNVAAGSYRKPKEQTQGNGGSRKKLAVAHRGMTRCAKVAWCKGQNKDDVAKGTQKGQAIKKRRWKGPECKN
jgi:hypothetical protein